MHTMYDHQVSTEDPTHLPTLPSFSSMSSALYRHRRKTIPVLPQTRAEVDLEDDWTRTTDDERFLLFSDGEENKILAFSTDQQLRDLRAAETVYMDGTFSSCPALWDQVYILHARKDCSTYPLVFVLLPDRQMTTYRRLLRLLKNHVQEKLQQQLAPSRMQTDFEIAAIQAIHAEFPNAEVKDYFFQYCQAVWRKTQNLGLAVLYKEDPQVQQCIMRDYICAVINND